MLGAYRQGGYPGRESINGEPVSLEPGNITDGISIYVQRQIYDTLVDFKPGTTEPVGDGLRDALDPRATN